MQAVTPVPWAAPLMRVGYDDQFIVSNNVKDLVREAIYLFASDLRFALSIPVQGSCIRPLTY